MGLGPSYRKLWTAAAISTVGDGVHLTALALLAASLTRDPLAVSAVVLAGQFPLLLFSLPGGALVDRWDGSAALLLAIRGRFRGGPREGARSTLRGEVVEGLRWLLGHRLLRALAVMVGVTNLMAGAWLAILVLFAREQLHVPAAGYGLLISCFAAGGVLGSLAAARLSRRFGTARVMIAEVALEGATSFAVGLVSNGWLAGGLLALLGFEVIVWNVVSSSLRQALLPDRLIGRVLSAYRLISLGTGPLGAVLGGVLGRTP